MPAEGVTERPKAGDQVTLKLDWGARYRRMRMHTALHLLSAVLPYPVTGGAVNEDDSRLDFDIPEAGLDKDADHRQGERDDQGRCRSAFALDHR